MAFRYDIYIKFKDGKFNSIHDIKTLFNHSISDIEIYPWRDLIHIGFHEHDDEVRFLYDLNNILLENHSSKDIEYIDFDGLERYYDGSVNNIIFPHTKTKLISTSHKAIETAKAL